MVAVISESMAKAVWGQAEALGQCFKIGSDTVPCRTVVGISEDIKHSDFRDDPGLNYYMPATQWRPAMGGLMLRFPDEAASHSEEVRRALQHEMPGSSYVAVTPLSEILAPERRQWELGATMFTIFGALAMVVAGVGLYSVIAYGVAQRTHELGVRVALGAGASDVIRLVLGEAIRLSALAAAIGTLFALLAGKWLKPLLFDTSPQDPWILGAVAASMLVIAAVASISPALRAARTDPNVALRAD
jgi:putative ABC transport system permease protein